MSKYSGLKFRKFDLHVHTPASYDFHDKTVTAAQIVEKALSLELAGIAITDHNTGTMFDEIKKAAEGKNIVIFPGVEISCTGGERGIHIIGILSPDQGTKHVEGILASLKMNPSDYGSSKIVTELSPSSVIDVITSEPYNGIAILAHCTSSKGVLNEIKGEIRTKIFEKKGLLAVETSPNDFDDQDKKDKNKRAIDLLNGEDPNFNFRKLGVYISSDSKVTPDAPQHTLEGIGARFTYFKVDDEISIESLRQCFNDRDTRIRQFLEYHENIHPFIKSIKVIGGFFDGQDAHFHKGLNTILGAKGAGKSLLVELMRFVLNQASSQKEIQDDHIRKLEKKLETYGMVELEVVDVTDATQKISRTFNPRSGNPYKDEFQENIANSFPVLFLSQNEIVKIAEDENEQIKFIDRFFDFKLYQNNIRNIEKDLLILDKEFADGLRAINDLKDIKKQLQSNDAELDKINKLLSDPIYDRYKLLEQKDLALKQQQLTLEQLKSAVEVQQRDISKFEFPVFKEPINQDPLVKRNEDAISGAREHLSQGFYNIIEFLSMSIEKLKLENKKWTSSFMVEKGKYEIHVRNAGGDRKVLEAQRLKIIKNVEDLKKREMELSKKTSNLKSLNMRREGLMKSLFEIHAEYYKERQGKCKKFEEESRGRLQVRIYESTNVDEFKRQLTLLKKGSYLKDPEIEKICANIRPDDFIINLLRYEATKDKNILDYISKKVELDIDRIQVLCDFLLGQAQYEDLLKIQYTAHPQDKPEIKFQVGDRDYELIRDISVGQKCTAMLIMALSDGNIPIVIDQPEDSLDVRSVWDDMCAKIRRGKENRQFIFTTHNSSLAVASDTDKFSVIVSDASKGSIVFSGALETAPVKEEVIKYLEGGRRTYQIKSSKYGM